jgi:hypothetical protein
LFFFFVLVFSSCTQAVDIISRRLEYVSGELKNATDELTHIHTAIEQSKSMFGNMTNEDGEEMMEIKEDFEQDDEEDQEKIRMKQMLEAAYNSSNTSMTSTSAQSITSKPTSTSAPIVSSNQSVSTDASRLADQRAQISRLDAAYEQSGLKSQENVEHTLAQQSGESTDGNDGEFDSFWNQLGLLEEQEDSNAICNARGEPIETIQPILSPIRSPADIYNHMSKAKQSTNTNSLPSTKPVASTTTTPSTKKHVTFSSNLTETKIIPSTQPETAEPKPGPPKVSVFKSARAGANIPSSSNTVPPSSSSSTASAFTGTIVERASTTVQPVNEPPKKMSKFKARQLGLEVHE